MRMKFVVRHLAVCLVVVLVGCAQTASERSRVQLVGDTPEESMRAYYQWVTSPDRDIVSAEDYWHVVHGDEIMKTLDVVRADTANISGDYPLVALFVRFSVGTDVYRDVYWVRRVGGQWVRSFSSYQHDMNNSLSNEASQWTNEGAEIFGSTSD